MCREGCGIFASIQDGCTVRLKRGVDVSNFPVETPASFSVSMLLGLRVLVFGPRCPLGPCSVRTLALRSVPYRLRFFKVYAACVRGPSV